MEGIVEQEEQQMEVTIHLLSLPEETKIWSGKYNKPITLDNIFNIQNEISLSVIQQMQVSLSAEIREQIKNVPTQNFVVYEAYLKGKENISQYYRHKDLGLLNKAEDYFKRNYGKLYGYFSRPKRSDT